MITLNVIVLALAGAVAEPPQPPSATYVRVENGSAQPLSNIQVRFYQDLVSYGDLAPGQASGYRIAYNARRYGYVSARMGDGTVEFRPVDYLGEHGLGPGRFTYRLVPTGGSGLAIQTSRDQ